MIWQGWGVMTLIYCLISASLLNLLTDMLWGEGFYQSAPWPIPLAVLLAGIFTSVTGLIVNKKPGRILLDPETMEKVEIKTVHSFFWIPMQYWGLIALCLSVWMYLDNLGYVY